MSALPKECFGLHVKSNVQFCSREGTVSRRYLSLHVQQGMALLWIMGGYPGSLCEWLREGVAYTAYNLVSECSFPSANRNCTAAEFTCANNQPPLRRCIPRAWVCDGDADCSDALDEHQNCTRRSCTENEFTCSNGLCIRNTYRFVTTQAAVEILKIGYCEGANSTFFFHHLIVIRSTYYNETVYLLCICALALT